MDQQLAEFKRKGKVLSGPLDDKRGGKGGGEFTRSAKLFRELEASAKGGGGAAGKKRPRPAAGEAQASSAKLKL